MSFPRSVLGLGIITFIVAVATFSFIAFQTSRNVNQPVPEFRFLIVGDGGGLYEFDGERVERIVVPTNNNLTDIERRHDGSYALITGKGNTLLRYNGTVVEQINAGLPTGTSRDLYALSWKPDDSEALIVGSAGTVLKYDGEEARPIQSAITGTIFDVSWDQKGKFAVLVGTEGSHSLVVKYDGVGFTKIPSSTSYTLRTVSWDPIGGYFLIGGDASTLIRLFDETLSPIPTASLCGGNVPDCHGIRDLSVNADAGSTLIVGNDGLTVMYERGALRRTEEYTDLNRVQGVDLHDIGDFYSVDWVPGSKIAYAVGQNGIIARIEDMKVTLLTQGIAQGSFRSIVNS